MTFFLYFTTRLRVLYKCMFIDKAKVKIKAGKGGDGKIAFLHEKYVPKGGPAGGNGGKGGSIYFVASKDENTLIAFRYTKKITAQDGGDGDIKNMYGKNAPDVFVKVPVGTMIYDHKEQKLLADMDEDGKKVLIARGGKGGRGNAMFKTSTNRVPRIAENGEPGEEFDLDLELKLLADVGLVGLPNAGKSTFISVVTNAKAEIAPYPFTTLSPNLGALTFPSGRNAVLADLPGLIEGASLGKGLGLDFLRHAERCRLILQLVDMSDEDPFASYKVIEHELSSYVVDLSKRVRIVCLTKADLIDNPQKIIDEFKKKIGNEYEVFAISSLTHQGVKDLLLKIDEVLAKLPKIEFETKKDDDFVLHTLKDEGPTFYITREKENTYRINGEEVITRYRRMNLSTDEGILRLSKYLRDLGVEEALKEKGIKEGDVVLLDDFEFEYFE